LLVILAGTVVMIQRDDLADHAPIVTYGPGSFLGELAQLSGRPALLDGQAEGAVDAEGLEHRRRRAPRPWRGRRDHADGVLPKTEGRRGSPDDLRRG
jgi:hypothetical protein